MKKRRALLIGVPEYESDAIDDLPIVCTDIETLHASLEKSGFSVRSVGTDGIPQTGRSKVLQALRRECKEAQGVETLLLYFSGHGMHYRGKDYLIPSDAVLDDADFVEEYLVPTDLGDIIDQSGAETVIFFVDACREGVKLDFKASYLAGWSRGERRQALRRSFVLAFACGPGQVSQYVGGEEGFSLFSKALAEVLDPQHPACTLREVLDETQTRLNALMAEHGKQPQKIYCAYESAVEDDTSLRVICDGVTAAAAKGKTSDPWSEAALQSSLWKAEGTDENCPVVQLKQQVAKVLTACWQQWQAAIRTFPQDPWRDEGLPIRVLDSLELLVFRSDPPVELTAAETALVVAVPFVREAVLASSVVQAATANPLSLEETSSKTGFRSALDKVHQGQPRFVRKAQRLKEQGRIADKDAVMAWLMHQCLLRSLEVWQPESAGGYLSSDFITALDNASCCRSRLVKETLARKRLLEFARCMYADFERIDRDDRPDALQFRLTVGRYHEEQQIREKMLAYLLKLAGLLAIDGRTLSEVLVDHIGLADPLTPEEVNHTVSQARWNPSGRGRTLRITCNHPAIDLALGEYVEQANVVLTHVFRQVGEKQQEMEALAGLPTHLMPDGITPEKQDGVPVYQTPHVNFQLAHDEVRELLMGEQLYGDPTLAIRELYQNALDACRYREARLKYLKQTGQYQGLDEEWEGHIIFRQRTDGNGRVYIECEDNGIGMGIQHLSQCFARAGRRFADLPEFIEEQAEWLRCDPPIQLYPNSQFGVGVLSYFMLADEIEVETCRLERKGRPGKRLRVRIPGSSGLFRVQELGVGTNAGTRVRLYLNRTYHEGKPISCLETLRKLLWVAEFFTEVQQGGLRELWNPGQLRHPDLPQDCCLQVEKADLWWLAIDSDYSYRRQKSGCILADGLWTEESQSCVVINLRGNYYPKLTVDRKQIVQWDRQWVHEMLLSNCESLLDWSRLTLQWLWNLSNDWSQVAGKLVDTLVRKNASVKLGRWRNDKMEVPIAKVGCFEGDASLLEYWLLSEFSILIDMPFWMLPYRILLWEQYGCIQVSASSIKSLPGWIQAMVCPVPQPEDALALSMYLTKLGRRHPRYWYRRGDEDRIPAAHIILASFQLNEPVAKTLERLQRFTHLGLEVSQIDTESLGNLTATSEDLVAFSDNSEKEYLTASYSLEDDRASVAYVILTAERIGESIAATLKRLQRLAPLGLEVPNVEPQLLDSLSATPEDLVAFSQIPENQISAAQVVLVAERLSEPIVATLNRLERFAPLGLEVPNVEPHLLESLSTTPEDLIALSKNLDGKSPLPKNQISVTHLVRVAERLNEPIHKTLERLERFSLLGLEIPNVNPQLLDSLSITSEDLIALPEDFDGKSPWPKNQNLVTHLVRVAERLNEPIHKTFERLERFAPLGLKVPDIDLEALSSLISVRENLIAVSVGLDGRQPWLKGRIHPSRIILAALVLGEPLQTTLERFRRFAPMLELTLPQGEPESWELFVGKRDKNADL